MINFKHIEPHRFLKDMSKIVLEHVHCVMQRYQFNANKHNPLRAGCHIKLPREIMVKKVIINVQITKRASHSQLLPLYTRLKKMWNGNPDIRIIPQRLLNLTNIEFSLTLSQIKKFETLNDISMSTPLRRGLCRYDSPKVKQTVNFLYVNTGHFAFIKDYIYLDYLSAKLEIHSENYGKLNECAIRLPNEEDKWLSFNNHCRKEHVPNSRKNLISVPMADFMRDDWEKFSSAMHYHVCEKLCVLDDTRVRDYLTERYRGPAHSNCNLNYKRLSKTSANNKAYENRLLIDVFEKTSFTVASIEYDIRDGLSQYSNRYAQTNNKYIPSYNLSKSASYLMYLQTDLPFYPTREKPQRYVTHRNLQQYTCHGLHIAKVHRTSLIYHIECDDTLLQNAISIDSITRSTNAYDISLVNKKVPSLMKDKNNDAIMTEFVELRAKMYALRIDGKKSSSYDKRNIVPDSTDMLLWTL
ncbi:hypothetical protein ALC53_04411 [Atta colombica]|uniref:Uncharacterized protein n=1 Tax=Atta colombica TaxID=520822 RepID=A0A195BKG0_9HYME|nr:hypothetical protein ALC53_04411 [Atta colombica]